MEALERQEARRLIETIYNEHTLNGSITGTRFESLLHNCLDILASQLYEKSTHFLLEIIQNADDNTYDNVTPTLSFTYRPGTLRIDCNEIGFTAQNVEAICAVNKSTKAGKTGDGEYIGEKGIGFKSVFKAADVVWIASRGFTFKFDKTQFLGMVVPIWEAYPEALRHGCTSILLQLAKDYDEATLIQELRTFDTNLLIFLRKLLRIEISIAGPGADQWANNISKVEHQIGAQRMVTLADANGSYEYLVRTHIIRDLPKEKKRQDWPYTKILLGFPIIARTESSHFMPQNVYASLPIRSFGLKVLVQADFLLTASREDIESTLPWNRAIREGIVQAFLQSIDYFNQDADWKYLWPCYLPSATTAAATFFEPAVGAILGALRERCVLETCANTLAKPTSLKKMAKESYTDDQGVPFTLNSRTKHRYISPMYPAWVLEEASAIGLTDLSPQDFLEDLVATIEESSSDFQSRSPAWHAQLADALIKLTTDPLLMPIIEKINLIPLYDCQWTSAKGNTIFFAKGESSLDIPSGIEVLVVDPIASADPRRQRLFSALGVKAWEAPEICRSILEAHQSPKFEPANISLHQLIAHVTFLYKAAYRPPKGTDLWFATTRNERCRGSKLYISGSSDPTSTVARVFAQLEKKFYALHPDYLTTCAADLQWPGWLVSELGLSRIPRLIVPLIEPKLQPVIMPSGDVQEEHKPPSRVSSPASVPAVPTDWMEHIDINSIDFDHFEDDPGGALMRPPSPSQPPVHSIKQAMMTSQGMPPQDGNVSNQVEQMLFAKFQQQQNNGGWQTTLTPAERVALVLPVTTVLNLTQPKMDHINAVKSALALETFHFAHSSSKEQYSSYMRQQLQLLQQKRIAQSQNINMTDMGQMGTMGNMGNMGNQQANMQGMMGRPMKPTMSNQGNPKAAQFNPQLSRSIQVSQLPIGAQATQGIQNNGMNNQKPTARGNHALQDYQTQLMLLEQQNKKRLLLRQQEMHNMDPDPEPPEHSASQSINRDDPTDLPRTHEIPTVDLQPEAAPIFTLSDEMTYMFETCKSSDVLQIFRDNWHHYSQWIDGAHMQWQDQDFLASSAKLKKHLASFKVQTLKDSLPLRDTVLPTVDSRLDRRCSVPTVVLDDPTSPGWAFLSHFGVLMKNDIHYYLRCLVALSQDTNPDIDDIAHIYEQIESRYQEHEALVRDIEAEYPRSTYLFRCLMSPTGNPIAPLIASASLITSSTGLEDISRLFQNICAALKDVNPANAVHLLRPLRTNAIFPIKRASGGLGYDVLADMDDKSWYIADRPLIYESFLGRLPLLAFSIEELSNLQELLRLLRLDHRLLSHQVKSAMQLGGRLYTHLAYTASLRSKLPFIKALIPLTEKDRAEIENRIQGLRVSISSRIMETFRLECLSPHLEGSPVRSQVALDDKDKSLHILMTRECASAQVPPHKLATMIAQSCGIKDPSHRALLYTTLCTTDLENLLTAFKQQGVSVKGLIIGKRSSQSGSSLRIPAFSESQNWMAGSFRGSSEAMRFNRSQSYRDPYGWDNDRRLPIIHLVGSDESAYDDLDPRCLVFENVLDGWDHLQYLGELMVSKMLSAYLGNLYRPERDWTGQFRERAGIATMHYSASRAAFYLQDAELVQSMTAFVIKFGKSLVEDWKQKLSSDVVYYLDVFVRAKGRTTPFAVQSGQIERMRRMRLQKPVTETGVREVSVLISVSDVYSDDGMTFDIFVDAWSLFEADKMMLKDRWLLTGVMPDDNSENVPRKRRKLDTPSINWADTGDAASLHRGRVTLRKRTDYVHQALQPGQMRLLYLLPGTSRDQLQGVIIHVLYSSAPLFRALSYVWGSTERKKTLLTPDGVLPITASLGKALHALRQKAKPMLIWCDAICINQEDHEEKVQQIQLLPRIFQRASSTYAYLNNTKNSDQAIEMLMQVRARAMIDERAQEETYRALKDDDRDENATFEEVSECEVDGISNDDDDRNETSSSTVTSGNEWPVHLRPIPDAWRESSIPHSYDDIWRDVETFFNSAWFRRAWIIQEIVATPQVKIVCGKWIIDWHDLHQAIEIVDRELESSDMDGPDVKLSWKPFLALAAQRDWEAERCRWTLITLLENFQFAQSTLYRDRLFALLGLASDGNNNEFEPDYESPLEIVVLRFARVFVKQGRGLQLLYRAGLNSGSRQFPSWIPDWKAKRPQCLYENEESGVSFAASGPQNAAIECVPGSDELSAAGYLVDSIARISSSCNQQDEWSEFFGEVDEMIDSATLSRVPASRSELKWKVPIAGALYPTLPASDGLDLESSYSAFRNYIKSTTSSVVQAVTDFNQDQAYAVLLQQMTINKARLRSLNYIAALGGVLEGWRFVITKRGYAGMVTNLAKEGDIVSIIKGGQVPFILRESESRTGRFRLVGESYIHGIMNGEAPLFADGVKQDMLRIH